MPRNISFALTKSQYIDGSKDVTRRMGWLFLRVGDILRPVEKCQGLKPGEKIKPLGGLIRVKAADREPLYRLTNDLAYGFAETTREGFPEGHELHHPGAFVGFFCASHAKCTPDSIVTRIEFERVK